MQAEQVLKECRVEGNVAYLPNVQLDRNEYLEVKKRLELIGGKWKGGKIGGFVFPHDPTELLGKVAGGDKVNIKKQFQFFATPDRLADELVERADLNRKHEVLEPSAGQGAIIKAIHRKFPEQLVYCYELMDLNRDFLLKLENIKLYNEPDFLKADAEKRFDTIIANPPFNKNQDIDHICKMYKLLAPMGRIVSCASLHWKHSKNKKETAFRDWLEEIDAEIIDVPAETFKESGTKIATCIIIIDKN